MIRDPYAPYLRAIQAKDNAPCMSTSRVEPNLDHLSTPHPSTSRVEADLGSLEGITKQGIPMLLT